MIKTYVGRYENGVFIIPESMRTDMPNNVRVIITVIDENVLNFEETINVAEHTVAENFLKAMESLRLDGFSEEDNEAIDALQRGEYRLNFGERLL